MSKEMVNELRDRLAAGASLRLHPTEISALMLMAYSHDKTTGEVELFCRDISGSKWLAGTKALAAWMGISEDTAKKVIKGLRTKGIVSNTTPTANHGRAMRYVLNLAVMDDLPQLKPTPRPKARSKAGGQTTPIESGASEHPLSEAGPQTTPFEPERGCSEPAKGVLPAAEAGSPTTPVSRSSGLTALRIDPADPSAPDGASGAGTSPVREPAANEGALLVQEHPNHTALRKALTDLGASEVEAEQGVKRVKAPEKIGDATRYAPKVLKSVRDLNRVKAEKPPEPVDELDCYEALNYLDAMVEELGLRTLKQYDQGLEAIGVLTDGEGATPLFFRSLYVGRSRHLEYGVGPYDEYAPPEDRWQIEMKIKPERRNIREYWGDDEQGKPIYRDESVRIPGALPLQTAHYYFAAVAQSLRQRGVEVAISASARPTSHGEYSARMFLSQPPRPQDLAFLFKQSETSS